MSDNQGEEIVPPALSGPDAPRFTPVAPGVVIDLALIESINLTNAQERDAASARAAEIVSDAEARAAKLIAAAVADAEEQVADVRPLAEAEAEKIVQEARDEASSILANAEETAAQIVAEAERGLSEAEERAAQIIVDAEAGAAELNRTLEIDRQLVKERLDALEDREVEVSSKLAEADRTLEHARTEAERMTTEAGEAVDRMMRSGQMAAASNLHEYQSDQEAVQALQAQHASDLRELTERYETKVSNQNIENLELRQEIETLRESLESLRAAPPKPETTPSAPQPVEDDPQPAVPAASIADDLADSDTEVEDDEDFVSPWIVPDVDEDVPEPTVDFDQVDEETTDDEQHEADEPARSLLGPSTGLAPNARLVEGLQASAFRSTEDPKKRRRRKR